MTTSEQRLHDAADVTYEAWRRGYETGFAAGKAEGLIQGALIQADYAASKVAPLSAFDLTDIVGEIEVLR